MLTTTTCKKTCLSLLCFLPCFAMDQTVRLIPAFRVVMYGESGAGKSALVAQLIHMRHSGDKALRPPREHIETLSTVGVDFSNYDFTHNNSTYRAQFWDTAGQERFHSVAQTYLRKAICVVLVVDVTNTEAVTDSRCIGRAGVTPLSPGDVVQRRLKDCAKELCYPPGWNPPPALESGRLWRSWPTNAMRSASAALWRVAIYNCSCEGYAQRRRRAAFTGTLRRRPRLAPACAN